MTNIQVGQKPAPSRAAIFRLYRTDDLAERLAVSERYILDLRDGYKRIRPGFRKRATHRLGQSEEVLFSETTEEHDGADQHAAG